MHYLQRGCHVEAIRLNEKINERLVSKVVINCYDYRPACSNPFVSNQTYWPTDQHRPAETQTLTQTCQGAVNSSVCFYT